MSEESDRINKTGDFLYKAFCVDIDCKFIKYVDFEGMTGLLYELDDSKRGKFMIAILKDKL